MAFAAEKRVLTLGMVTIPGAYVAGGALTSVFTRQPINDFDIYFKSIEAFRDAVEAAYEDGLWCVDVSTRAVTFSDQGTIYQFMHFGFFPTARDIFAAFDFTCCMAAYDHDSGEFTLHDEFLTHCAQRYLRFNPGTRYPLASAVRVIKYQGRGYTIGKGDMLRIALACRGVEINSWEQLKDQIGGAYGTKVMLAADGEFSLAAAIDALTPDELWSPTAASDTPCGAVGLFDALTELCGLSVPVRAEQAA